MLRFYRLLGVVWLLAVVKLGNCDWKQQKWNSKNFLEGWNARLSFSADPKVVDDPHGGHDSVLRVFYPKDSSIPSRNPRGGLGFYAKPHGFHPRNRYTLSYEVYFPDGFKFVKGGKLPGLGGGTEKCSGGNDAVKYTCFSTRYMWRENGQGEVYAYIPKHQKKDFGKGSDVIGFDKKYGTSLGRGKWTFKTKQWNKISQEVQINTPGKCDGYVKVHCNGHSYEKTGLNFTSTHGIKIDYIQFSTFFGGSSSAYKTPEDQYSYFRNFKVTAD